MYAYIPEEYNALVAGNNQQETTITSSSDTDPHIERRDATAVCRLKISIICQIKVGNALVFESLTYSLCFIFSF